MKTLLLLCCLQAAAASVTLRNSSPVERVVKLMTDMRKSILKQQEEEQTMYDKFRCWTVNTAQRKADAITQAERDMRMFFQEIQIQTGLVKVLSNEIAGLQAEIKGLQFSLDKMTATRTDKHNKYEEATDTAKATIKALLEAIRVLEQGQAQGGSSLLQRQAVKAVAKLLPSDHQHVALLNDFSEQQYAPQSGAILGILKSQIETAAKTVESLNDDEGEQSTAFEEFQFTKQTSIDTATKSMNRKLAAKADAEAALAEAETSFEDTDAQRKADVEFWNTITRNGLAKKDEWETRESMRESELKGINAALKIMTSDEARATFSKAISLFQIKRHSTRSSAMEQAYSALKKTATKFQNVNLALLAVRIHEEGPFDGVIKVLDEQLDNLKAEGNQDTQDRDKCKNDLQNITSAKATLSHKIDKNDARIAKYTKQREMAQKEREAAIQAEKDERAEQAEMTDQRKTSNAEYVQAKKDDQAALALLNKALDKVSKFYKENALLQKNKGPEFKKSADQAPDATFSSADSHATESGGVMSLMQNIIEGVEQEIRTGDADEATAQQEYEQALSESEDLLDKLIKKQENLEQFIAELEDKTNHQEKAKSDNKKEFTRNDEWEKNIRPDCDWLLKNFETRRFNRAQEAQGVEQAKNILRGAAL